MGAVRSEHFDAVIEIHYLVAVGAPEDPELDGYMVVDKRTATARLAPTRSSWSTAAGCRSSTTARPSPPCRASPASACPSPSTAAWPGRSCRSSPTCWSAPSRGCAPLRRKPLTPPWPRWPRWPRCRKYWRSSGCACR